MNLEAVLGLYCGGLVILSTAIGNINEPVWGFFTIGAGLIVASLFAYMERK